MTHRQGEVRPHISRNFAQIFRTVEWSLSTKMTVPALILLYSAIDIAANLASDNADVSSKKRFVKWVNRYVGPQTRLSCSALDLYGARCGLVHAFAAISALSRKGEAKQIHYAYGDSDPTKLLDLAKLAQIDSAVVHVDHLFEAVREGVQDFLDGARSDLVLLERINRNARFAFENMSDATADKLLLWGRETLSSGS